MKTIRELELKLLLATRRYLSEGDRWSCKAADLQDMRDIFEDLKARESFVQAWVNGEQAHNVWDFDHPNATPDELKAARVACIEAALRYAGIPVTTQPPTDDEIEEEMETRAQEYGAAMREWYTAAD